MGTFTKEAKVIIHDLFNVLMRGIAEIVIIFAEPITTKVKEDCTSAFELELMLIGDGLDDGGRIFARNE